MDNDLILKLYNRHETVFTVDEIAQLVPEISAESLLDRLYYFTKIGKLKRIRHGIYSKVNYELLAGLGDLLENKQKVWVREHLKEELLFQLKLYQEIHWTFDICS